MFYMKEWHSHATYFAYNVPLEPCFCRRRALSLKLANRSVEMLNDVLTTAWFSEHCNLGDTGDNKLYPEQLNNYQCTWGQWLFMDDLQCPETSVAAWRPAPTDLIPAGETHWGCRRQHYHICVNMIGVHVLVHCNFGLTLNPLFWFCEWHAQSLYYTLYWSWSQSVVFITTRVVLFFSRENPPILSSRPLEKYMTYSAPNYKA